MEWVMIKPPTWDHFDVLQGGSTAEASATRGHVDLHHNNTAPMSWPGSILEAGDNSGFNNLQPRGGSSSNNISNCNNHNSSSGSNNNVVPTQLGISRSRISSQLCMQGSPNGAGFMATASSGHPSNGNSFNYSTGTSSQLPSSTSSSDQEEGRSHAGVRGRVNGSWQLFMGDIKGEAADDHGRYNDRSDHHAGDHAVMQEMAAATRAGGRYNVSDGSGFPRVASGLHLLEKPKSELIHAVKVAPDTETTDVSTVVNISVMHDHGTKKDLNNGNNQDDNNNSNASLANTGPHEHHPKRPLEMNDAAASSYGRAGKKPHHRTSSSHNNNNSSNNNGHTNNPMQHQNVPRCQVEGCREDLSKAKKDYHRRHKVCEAHSKAPRVIASGMEQRFCQQCSRFHVLSEFDDAKRSCRKRLAGHNERRRKSSQDSSALSAASIFQDDRMRRLSYLMQHPALSVALPLQQYDHAGSTLASRARNGAWSSSLDDINLAMVCRAQAALMSGNASAGSADAAQRLLNILQAQNHNNNHHHHHQHNNHNNNSSSSNVKLASAYENDYGSNSCHEIVPFKSNGNNVDHHQYQSSGGNNGILGEGLSLSSSTASISAGSSNCSSQGPTSSNTNNTDNHNNNTMLFAASLEAAAAAASTRSTHHNQQQSALLDSGRALSLLSSGQVLQPNTSTATNFTNKHPSVLITSSPSPTHQHLNPTLNSLSIAQHHHQHSHHHYNNIAAANTTTTDSPLTAAAADHADNHQLLSCTSQQLALSIGMCGTSVLDEKETMMSSNYNIKPLMQALSGANPGILARLMQQQHQQQQQGAFSSDNSHSITVNHSGQHTTGLDSVDLLLSTSHHENLHSLRAAASFEPSLFTAHANY